jgi:hypothetical protein
LKQIVFKKNGLDDFFDPPSPPTNIFNVFLMFNVKPDFFVRSPRFDSRNNNFLILI